LVKAPVAVVASLVFKNKKMPRVEFVARSWHFFLSELGFAIL